ncbi:MAG: ankyrin repeat domain-containing protein [Amoebophilaceae bacterium]|nr:ankyrin repeat domain-containing protein [Amoebophilaceae bacterium]
MAYGADPNFTPDTATKSILYHAVEARERPLVELLLKYGADLSYHRYGTGDTPLHLASRFEKVAILQALLAHAAIDLDVSNNAGLLPLHEAFLAMDATASHSRTWIPLGDNLCAEILLRAGSNIT